MTHSTYYNKVKNTLNKLNIFFIIGIVLVIIFILISTIIFGNFWCECLFRIIFSLVCISLLYLHSKKEMKVLERQYIHEKNNVVGSLSLKYKKSLEQMYDEHIFSITHELRSPLAVIDANSNAQISDLRSIYTEIYDKTDETIDNKFRNLKKRIHTINDQVDIIESFISNLAEYGSYVSSRNDQEFKIINIKSYLKNIISNAPSFSRTMKVFGPNIKIADEKDFDTIHVPVNANDLTRILINVFKNSADAVFNTYTKLKDTYQEYIPQLNIRCIKTKNKNASIILKDSLIGPFGNKRKESPFYLVIEDNGPGISEDNKHKIFSYGFSTKDKVENMGLGLHICMQLAEQNDLSLYFDTCNKGTRFIIGFPHVLFLNNDSTLPEIGWLAEENEIYISNDSKQLFESISKSVI